MYAHHRKVNVEISTPLMSDPDENLVLEQFGTRYTEV